MTLAEIDWEPLGGIEVRDIFVGATRATMKLFLVMSKSAVTWLGSIAAVQAQAFQ